MKNNNKFITTEERHKAFRAFCESHISCSVCILQRDVSGKYLPCNLRWLDLEEGTDEDDDDETPQWEQNILNKFTKGE